MAPHVDSALIVGASRGLGFQLAVELVERGWSVVATTRTPSDALDAAIDRSGGRLRAATVDMTDNMSLAFLHDEFADERFEVLFVNGAINRSSGSIAEASTDEFIEVMMTNALAPLRTLDALQDLVTPNGTIAIMSSEQGSITRNEEERFEVYKASKAALNQLTRSYANRYRHDGRTKLLIDPGHNRTSLGGDTAPFDPVDSMARVATLLDVTRGQGRLAFVDRDGETVPW